jgi:hypothetical protein
MTETSQKIQRVEYMISISCTDICGEEDFSCSRLEEVEEAEGNGRNFSGRYCYALIIS